MSAAAKFQFKSGTQTVSRDVKVGLPFRDQMHLQIVLDAGGEILTSSLTVRGCTQTLLKAAELRQRLSGKLADVTLPSGSDHTSILLRELILKARGEWSFPYQEEELCHCRRVSTAKVDQAIVNGLHTLEEIKRGTSANTSCGACRWDIEAIIDYRVGRPAK